MKTILMTLVAWDAILGIAMYAYLLLQWHTEKWLIKAHGWNIDYANPAELRDIWRWFIPVYGFVMYVVAGTIVEEMAFKDKRDCNGRIVVNVLGFDFVYQQPIA